MRGGDRAALGELVSCAAAAPTFPRPRGRGPPDCTWDVQLGSWLRADGSAWVKVRNEKRDRAREAQRVEKQAKQALISTSKAERGLLEQSRKDQSRKDRESLKHVKEERLQLKGEVREAREAEAEARDARVQEVLFDGETVYCAKHLYQLNAGDAHVKCGTCADLGWHDVRHAPPHPVNFSPTPTPSLSEPTFPCRCVFYEDGRFQRFHYYDGACTAKFVCRREDKTNPLKSQVYHRQDPRRFRKDLRLPKYGMVLILNLILCPDPVYYPSPWP